MRPIVNARRPRGFTLIELSVVILIIGLLLAFVLAASLAGAESARVRATQALITKLNDRVGGADGSPARHPDSGQRGAPVPRRDQHPELPRARAVWFGAKRGDAVGHVYQNTDQRAAGPGPP